MPWKRRVPSAGLDGVPAHVREDGGVQLGDGARPFAEAVRIDAALHAALEEHLHPDADAEHGATAREPPVDELIAAARPQRLHDGVVRADAGHDEAVGVEDERLDPRSAEHPLPRRRAP